MDHRKKSGDKMWNGNGQVDKLSSTFTSSSSASISGNSSFYHCETRKEVTTSRCLKESSTVSHSREVPLQTSSFILQRVERLYGPGALAQGFYTRRSHSNSHSAAPQKEAVPEEAVKDEVGASALPVLRLLRPEFRAQLSLAKRKSGSPSARASDSPDGAVERVIPIIDLCCGDKTENHKQIEERETATKPIEKDGPYYLKLVTEETERLLLQAAELEAEMASAPEHAEGRLRAAAGKARLLANQKLAQFKGLCHKNINQDLSEDFPTTCEDLAGFWDMVSIQVNSVHEEFNQIDALRKAGWPLQEASEDKKEVLSNGCGSGGPRRAKAPTKSAPAAAPAPAPAKSSLSKARDEARKRMLAERRKEMRKNANTTDDIVIV